MWDPSPPRKSLREEIRMPPEAEGRKVQGSTLPENASAVPDRPGRDADTLQLWQEEVSFDRERVETGRVRVRTVTREHEEMVDVPLTREHVEVERVPIGREIETMPASRQEGDITIVPVVEEIVVTRRKLILKEEVHLRLVRTTEQHRESVILRRHEAVIERLPAGQAATEPKTD
jgi:uncharacterized protein (TIGR02271 family)